MTESKEAERKYQREYKKRKRAENPEKSRAYQREWARKKRLEDPDYFKRTQRKRPMFYNSYAKKYGMGGDELKDKLKELISINGESCWACGNSAEERRVVIDHDHNSGLVRGLLCHNCNLALGLLGDNPETILSLYRYLCDANRKTQV